MGWYRRTRAALAVIVVCAVAQAVAGGARADFSGGAAELTRVPYLTDLTASSVQVTWATTTQTKGVVKYGTPGDCAASSVTSATLGTPITVNGVREYQNSVTLSGLAAGTAYCYRPYSGVDLLGANPSPKFTTLEPAESNTPFSFAVFGDWGDTTDSGVNDGTTNVNQAGVMSQLAASNVRFALSTGDIAYPSGTQTNYGDLTQSGVNISGVFGPSYYAATGQGMPLYTVSANHGRNATFLNVWPQSAIPTASGGVYSMVDYPSIDGTTAGSYPTSYYAFTTGGVRFYMLDASWGDSNVGTATGGTCGSHCAMYQVDHDAHWTTTAAEYQWLKADLAAHPGGIKVAAFHFPLRSDDATEPDDAYLKWTPGSTGTVEQLLHDNGVRLVFNGHAHIYERNIAPPGGVTAYITGGGGAKASSVSKCSTTDAYAVGWSYSSNKGSKCGAAAAAPSSDSQVYNFLKVTVNGSKITVTPTDSKGNTFDATTYDFGDDTTAPSAPGLLAVTQPSSTKAKLTWNAATDNVGLSAYDIYRNGDYLVTTAPEVTTYTDATVVSGAGYDYKVVARDLAGNTGAATVSINGGGASDTTPPSVPTGLTGAATGATSVGLSWNASTDDVAVAGYTIMRNGVQVAQTTATSYTDTGLTPGTDYTYSVVARDTAGNTSAPSDAVTVTTQADTTPPTKPGTPAATTAASTEVDLAWTAATDDVGVLRYDVLRNGTVIGTPSGTTFADTSVSPGTTYTYTIRAYDAAGNYSTSDPLTVTTLQPGSVFYDGFESGDLSAWTTVNGFTVGNSVVKNGSYAARETSTGSVTYAYKTLPSTYTELSAQAWVYVTSRSTSVNLFGFRTSTTSSIVNVYIDTNGRLSLRNNAGGVTTYSTTTIAAGGWHWIALHAVVNGTSSSMEVSLDGTVVPGLTLTGQDLGTSPIAKLQLGETSTGRTYDVSLDDVTVTPPS